MDSSFAAGIASGLRSAFLAIAFLCVLFFCTTVYFFWKSRPSVIEAGAERAKVIESLTPYQREVLGL